MCKKNYGIEVYGRKLCTDTFLGSLVQLVPSKKMSFHRSRSLLKSSFIIFVSIHPFLVETKENPLTSDT